MRFEGLWNRIADCVWSMLHDTVSGDIRLQKMLEIRSSRHTSLQHPACAMLLQCVIIFTLHGSTLPFIANAFSWEYSTIQGHCKVGLY